MASLLRSGAVLAAWLAGATLLPAAPAGGGQAADAALNPLVRPGRTLHFRGRSRHQSSHADLAPAAQVAFVTTRLDVREGAGAGWLELAEETLLYAADGTSLGRLDMPRDRRTRTIRVHPASGRLQPAPLYTTSQEADRRRSRTLEITRTDDGFGLNAAASTAVGLPSLLLPADLFATLARQEEHIQEFDFWLVADDPRADRRVVPADAHPNRPPVGAEGRVRGTTRLRPRGRETFRLTFRPALPGDSRPPEPPPSRPDRRVELPALAVSVRLDLVMEWLPDDSGSLPPAVRRQDRMTWLILDSAREPWILEMDGSIEMEVGALPDHTLRETYLSRRLDLVSEGPS